MQRNKGGQAKGGLADLKRLRQQAEAHKQPPKPSPAPKRKRAFQMPGAGSPRPAVGESRPATGNPGRAAMTRLQTANALVDPSLLTEEDRKLFRSAVKFVDQIKDPGRLLLKPVADAPASILKERRLRAAGIEPPKPGKKVAKDNALNLEPSVAAKEEPSRSARKTGRRSTPLSDGYAPTSVDLDDSTHLKPGHGTDVLRDLKRGRWPIGATLDLHGSTLEDARERFERFIGSCLTHDVKCVHIVHGKGHGSRDGEAVLKTTVRRWLTQMPEVIAYIECAEPDGGAGAVQVLLK